MAERAEEGVTERERLERIVFWQRRARICFWWAVAASVLAALGWGAVLVPWLVGRALGR